MKVHLTIWDQQGNQLYHGEVPSCFDSLRPDDVFWLGEPEARQWVKVARMTYGVRTKDGSVYLEMVVERSEQNSTRVARTVPQVVDHGQFEFPHEGGDITFPKGSCFSVNVGPTWGQHHETCPNSIEFLTIRYKDSDGKEDAKSFTGLKAGESRYLRVGAFRLNLTVLSSSHRSIVQVTEDRRLE